MKSIYDTFKNAKRRLEFEKNILPKRLSGENVMLPLYSKDEIKEVPSKKKVKLVPFLIGENKPTVILCPGGAYQFVSYNNEGYEPAKELNRLGYNAFMLIYRTSKDARFPAPMEDLARTICYLKHSEKQFNIDAENIYICGASAGGHLTAYFAAKYQDFEKPYMGENYSLRPKGIILSYPVISLCKETHEVSCKTLLGKDCTEEDKKAKSVELIATETYPPTFVWHCEDDATVPVSNSVRLDERLTEKGVRHRFIKYPQGGHGIGLAEGTSAEGWIYEAERFLREI